MFLLNKITIKAKGWILVLATFFGFMSNIGLVLFALDGIESRNITIEKDIQQILKTSNDTMINTKILEDEEDFKEFFELSRTLLVGGTLLGLVFFMFFTYLMIKSITNSVDSLSEITIDLASGSGDLTKRINVNSKDEISSLAKNINNFISKIHETVKVAKTSSNENEKSAHNISNATTEIEKRTTDELIFVEETKQIGDSIKIQLQNVNQKSSQTSKNIQGATQALENAAGDIKNLVSNIHQAVEVESETANKLMELTSQT